MVADPMEWLLLAGLVVVVVVMETEVLGLLLLLRGSSESLLPEAASCCRERPRSFAFARRTLRSAAAFASLTTRLDRLGILKCEVGFGSADRYGLSSSCVATTNNLKQWTSPLIEIYTRGKHESCFGHGDGEGKVGMPVWWP